MPAVAGESLQLTTRRQVRSDERRPEWRDAFERVEWDARLTAVVICDMWDRHWCKNATDRVAAMAPRMNELVRELRRRGCQIIHCPSNTLEFYKDHPGRRLAQHAPRVNTQVPLESWCHLDPQREALLPIDDRDGGCDSEPLTQRQFRAALESAGLDPGQPWSRQIEAIEIHEGDAITDSADALYLMRHAGITNVIVMGVHTNMCVLGRPFSIRQMVRQGQRVLLVRDLTDTMYNPAQWPFVSHFAGTDLVVQHVERYWCPTITSDQLIGGRPYRFPGDTRQLAVIVMAEDEYHTDMTLTEFADKYLRSEFRLVFVYGHNGPAGVLPGIEQLEHADLAVLSVRRCTPPAAQLQRVRQFIERGRPLVAIRTSSHAFALRDQPPASGHAAWPEFDQQVLGCNYVGHHGNKGGDDPRTFVRVVDAARDHPILTGVRGDEFGVSSWLYKSSPLVSTAESLMTGRVAERLPHEPVAWTNRTAANGRVFYTSLGHAGDFQLPAFQQLLLNGIRWAAATEGSRDARSEPQPLPAAHAHNDYHHPRPLWDALDLGFSSVEADVFLVEGQLLVGHSRRELHPARTLEALYLEPLRRRAEEHGGRIYPDGPVFTLLVDLKSEGAPTYKALRKLLARYADMLSVVRDGQLREKAVTVIISGNRPQDLIAQDDPRYAGIDGRVSDLGTSMPAHLMPLISDQWSRHFSWNGEGPMPADERKRLEKIVTQAHAAGRRVRFWATPENPRLWSKLRAAHVDLIGTDQLVALSRFLQQRGGGRHTGEKSHR